MNYFEHTIEKREGDIYILRNGVQLFCPRAVGEPRCGSWCAVFQLEVFFGLNSEGGIDRSSIGGAEVTLCSGQAISIKNYKVLEEKDDKEV
jgi:hypothetical protein